MLELGHTVVEEVVSSVTHTVPTEELVGEGVGLEEELVYRALERRAEPDEAAPAEGHGTQPED